MTSSVAVLFSAITPPNADVGSVEKALSYAFCKSSAEATPHGFVCFTIQTVGSSNSAQHDHADNASTTLLYDICLPCMGLLKSIGHSSSTKKSAL